MPILYSSAVALPYSGAAESVYAGRSQIDLPSFMPITIFVVLAAVSLGLGALVGQMSPPVGFIVTGVGLIISALLAGALKVANEWERGIILRLGTFVGIRGPGIFLIIPIVDRVRFVDTRVVTRDVRRQEVITRDNVPIAINGVLFFKVDNVEAAVLRIQDYAYAITELAKTALRDVVGGMTLDEVLAERERVGKMVEALVEKDAPQWGLAVTGIRLQDIDMPEELKKIMSRQAAAEREKRATITKAEGDRMAAENLAAAAATMTASPGAMQLRTLQTIDGLGPTASNTVVLAIPIEIMQAFKKLGA